MTFEHKRREKHNIERESKKKTTPLFFYLIIRCRVLFTLLEVFRLHNFSVEINENQFIHASTSSDCFHSKAIFSLAQWVFASRLNLVYWF
jgi:hypothetical protein